MTAGEARLYAGKSVMAESGEIPRGPQRKSASEAASSQVDKGQPRRASQAESREKGRRPVKPQDSEGRAETLDEQLVREMLEKQLARKRDEQEKKKRRASRTSENPQRPHVRRRSELNLGEGDTEIRPRRASPSPETLGDQIGGSATEGRKSTRRPTESPRGRTETEAGAETRPGRRELLDSMPNARDLTYDLVDSERDQDKAFSAMLIELNERDKHKSLKDWSDEHRAVIYEEWKAFTKFYAKKKKEAEKRGLTPEDVRRNNQIDGTLAGVKKVLLKDVQGKDEKERRQKIEAITSGDILKERRAREFHAEDIPNKKVRDKFSEFIIQMSNGEISSPEEIAVVRQEWRRLEEKLRSKLEEKGDLRSLDAFDRVRDKIVVTNKQLLSRREEEPLRLQARGASATGPSEEAQEEEESSRSETEPEPQARERVDLGEDYVMRQKALELQKDLSQAAVIAELIDQGYGRAKVEELFRIKSEEEKMQEYRRQNAGVSHEQIMDRTIAENEEMKKKTDAIRAKEKKDPLKKAKKEARTLWQAEKNKMASLKDMKTKEKFGIHKDWEKFGWTREQKNAVATNLELGKDIDKAAPVLRAMLLAGWTGKEAVEFTKKDKRDRRGSAQQEIVMQFLNDEEVADAFDMAQYRNDYNDQRYQQEPGDAQELAWQIGHILWESFGEEGENPTLERKVRITDEDGKLVDIEGNFVDREGIKTSGKTKKEIRFKTHENVKKDNIVLFFRQRANYQDYQNPNDAQQFDQVVDLPSKQSMSQLNLQKMLAAQEKMFMGSDSESVSKDILREVEARHGIKNGQLSKVKLKEDHKDLAPTLEREAMSVTTTKSVHLAYIKQMEIPEELKKLLENVLDKNLFTRDIHGGRPLLQHIMTLPGHYESAKESDGAVGAAITKSFLAYYNLSDYEKLEKELGEEKIDERGDVYYDASQHDLFNVHGLRKIRDKIVSGHLEEYSDQDPDRYYNLAYKRNGDGDVIGYENSDVDAAFNINGTIKSKGKFIDLINIFNAQDKDSHLVSIVKEAIGGAVAQKEGLNEINTTYANMTAFYLTRIMGAGARGDTKNVQAVDSMVKYTEAGAYYEKMDKDKSPDSEGESEARGGKSSNKYHRKQFKRLIEELADSLKTTSWVGPEGARFAYRESFLDVCYDLSEARRPLENPNLTEEQRREYQRHYQNTATNKMRFKGNAERNWFANQFARAVAIDEYLRGQKQLDFLSYSRHVSEVGTVYDIDKFQKDINGFITDLRYIYDTYGDTEYHKPRRAWDPDKPNGEGGYGAYRDMTVAEARFGRKLLDADVFKTDGKLDPIKVNEHKADIRLQAFMVYVGSEILAARELSKYATHQRFDFSEVNMVLDVMKKLPGDMFYDEDDPKRTEVSKPLLGKRRMEYLKEFANVTFAKLWGLEFLKETFMGTKDEKTKFWSAVAEFWMLILKGGIS